MAYTKQTWENLPSQTTPINADRLTHIEDGIFNAAATADTAASDASSAISGLADKVDKVEGKGLSTNDFTDALKTKLDNIETGAEVNVQSDWNENDSSSDAFIQNKPTLGTSAYKNSTSVVTDSTDLVESGAVKDIVGWGNKNLCDPANMGHGVRDTSTGQITSQSDNASSTTEPIKVKSGATYVVSQNSVQIGSIALRVFYYGSDMTFISTELSNPFTIPSNAEYVAFQNGSSFGLDNWQMELGSTATAYEPYHASVEDTLRDAEVVEGKNLLPVPYTTGSVTKNGITWTVNSDGSVTANGTATANSSFSLYQKEDINFSGLKLSGCPNGGSDNTYFAGVALYNSPYTRLANDFGEGADIPNYTQKVMVYIRVSNGVTVSNLVFKPMISKDGGDYEPYYVPLKDVVPNKCDNSAIAPTENGTTASQAYAVGSHAIRNGAFITWKNAKAQGETINDASDYTSGDVASELNKQTFIPQTADLNDFKTFGWYYWNEAPTNSPEAVGYSQMQIIGGSSIKQIVYRPNAIYIRNFIGAPASWKDWYKFNGTIVS